MNRCKDWILCPNINCVQAVHVSLRSDPHCHGSRLCALQRSCNVNNAVEKPADWCPNVETYCTVNSLHTHSHRLTRHYRSRFGYRTAYGPKPGSTQLSHMHSSLHGTAVSKIRHTQTWSLPAAPKHSHILYNTPVSTCSILAGEDTFSHYTACWVNWGYQQVLHTPVNVFSG